MYQEYSRIQRIESLIQRALADIFLQEIIDPKLKWLSIVSVTVSKDLAYADVSVIQLENQITPDALIKQLKEIAPRLRTSLAEKLSLRKTPRLRFYYDRPKK
jgi:ribosome-binding factor A